MSRERRRDLGEGPLPRRPSTARPTSTWIPENPNVLLRGALALRAQALDPHERQRSRAASGSRWTAGRTWKKLEKGLPKLLGRIAVKVAPSNPQVVYVLAESKEGTLFRSSDRRRQLHRDEPTNPNIVNRGFYYTDLRVDPTNEDRALCGLLDCSRSPWTAGKSWKRISRTTHIDFHSLWIDPQDPARMWQGQDGGRGGELRPRREAGSTRTTCAIGQFYQVCSRTTREPFYYLGGGMQDNGTWWGPSRTREPAGILNDDWRMVELRRRLLRRAPPRRPRTCSCPSPRAAPSCAPTCGRGSSRSVSPQPRRNDGGPVARAQVPLQLERADRGLAPRRQDRLLRGQRGVPHAATSASPGRRSARTSPRTTRTSRRTPAGPSSRRTPPPSTTARSSASRSRPRQKGVLWTGSDDGLVQVSRDDGKTWTNVTRCACQGLPAFSPVSHVEPSRTVGGHRLRGLRPSHVRRLPALPLQDDRLRQDLFGRPHGRPPRAGLRPRGARGPEEPAPALRGHRARPLRSLGRRARAGRAAASARTCRTVAVHDILVHPRENDLILGHPRPRPLDPRRRGPRAAAGHRRSRQAGPPVPGARGGAVRDQDDPLRHRRHSVQGRQPAVRGDHHLPPEREARQGRQAPPRGARREGPGDPEDREEGADGGRMEPRGLGPLLRSAATAQGPGEEAGRRRRRERVRATFARSPGPARDLPRCA